MKREFGLRFILAQIMARLVLFNSTERQAFLHLDYAFYNKYLLTNKRHLFSDYYLSVQKLNNMKLLKSIVLMICVSHSVSLHAQQSSNTLTSNDLLQHTSNFTIDNEIMKGPGARVLAQIARKSQFVIVGETHGSSQTSNFVSAWLPDLSKQGFDYFACEVGPHSAHVLTRLSTPAESTKENLRKFHEHYYMEAFDDSTIPFFDGIEDARFLQVAAEHKMTLWGLDQEYYYSIMHLTDELANTTKHASNYNQILEAKKQVEDVIYQYYLKEDTSAAAFDAFEAILDDHTVNQYFNLFHMNNQAAQSIIEDIKISFDIYINWQRGSHADRVSYMRNNLIKEIAAAKTHTGVLPKVFLKFGQAHASKILSNGAYDIGHLLQELACQTGSRAVNIALARRFVYHNGEVVDLLEQLRSPYGKNTSFLSVGKQNEAAIINLSDVRCDLRMGKYSLPVDGDYHRIKKVLDGFDYLIILPIDQRAVRLF